MKYKSIILAILTSIIFIDADISISIFNSSFRVILNDGCLINPIQQVEYSDSIFTYKNWQPIDTTPKEKVKKIANVNFRDTIDEAPDNAVSRFIELNKDVIIDSWSKGVLPSVKMAQAIIESASGTSEICLAANNYLGIKCRSCDTTFNGWRIFKDKKDCFDYLDRLYNRAGRYKHLIGIKDVYVWTTQLRECGYATSQSYPESLMYNIMLYDLHKLDEIAFNKFSNT